MEIILSLMFPDVIFQGERRDNRKYVCCSQATSKGELMPKDSTFLGFFGLEFMLLVSI